MTTILRNVIAILFLIAVTLPILFLLTISLGDITASASPDQWGLNIIKQVSLTIALFWFFDLALLILVLAFKEIATNVFPPHLDESEDL